MSRNPYEPPEHATSNFLLTARRLLISKPSGKKRMLFWFLGFVFLFLSNVLVESLILPNWGLENTPRNDIYFQTWWLLVGVWLVFGNIIISAFQRTTDVS